MTEKQWLAGKECWPLLEFCISWVSKRKLHLFAVACCHRMQPALHDPRAWKAVEVTERYADGAASGRQLAGARRGAIAANRATADSSIEELATDAVVQVARVSPYGPAGAATNVAEIAAHITVYGCPDNGKPANRTNQAAYARERKREDATQCALLREIVGNPFRPVTFDADWRTSDVLLLAKGIYAEKAFDRMPILADALQDAGCDRDALLRHLRDPQAEHVRGCWALDLVLGKE